MSTGCQSYVFPPAQTAFSTSFLHSPLPDLLKSNLTCRSIQSNSQVPAEIKTSQFSWAFPTAASKLNFPSTILAEWCWPETTRHTNTRLLDLTGVHENDNRASVKQRTSETTPKQTACRKSKHPPGPSIQNLLVENRASRMWADVRCGVQLGFRVWPANTADAILGRPS